MAATLEQIMAAIEAALTPLPNLRVDLATPDAVSVSGNASVAVIPVPTIDSYRETMGRGTYQVDVPIVVFVSSLLDRRGQLKLAAFANQTGSSSIRAAIEADMTLGGVVNQAYLLDFEPLGIEEVGAIGYYGGRFRVRVTATGA